MKNLSTLFFAAIVVLSGGALLHAQSTPSGFTNPAGSSYTNQSSQTPTRVNPNTQWGTENPTPTQWGTQNQTQWGTQNPTTTQGQVTNPNQPYTQPSNISTQGRLSYNDPTTTKIAGWTDEDIAQKIRWTIRSDKTLSPLAKSTEITVKNFNVTLSGTVSSNDEKARISAIARQTEGVKSVSNNITVTNK